MKVLLSDGSSATALQLAAILGGKGHQVHVLCESALVLTRFTKWVVKLHRVPCFSLDPYRWLGSALSVLRASRFDVFICAHEHVAIASASADQFRSVGVKMAMPSFEALSRVMDKISAYETLRQLQISQPETSVAHSVDDLLRLVHMVPAYIKAPIGTANARVGLVSTPKEMATAALECETAGTFGGRGALLVQKAIPGPVLMVTSVFSHGHLLAWHACLKVRDGPLGGAAKRRSLPLAFIRDDLVRLGQHLQWDGPLSADAIFVVKDQKVYYININPGILEPMNALFSGVDLVNQLLQASTGDTTAISPVSIAVLPGEVNMQSHQILAGLLRAAENGRLAIIAEVFHAATGAGDYRGSREELFPLPGDLLGRASLFVIVVALVIGGSRLANYIGARRASMHTLSLQSWDTITSKHEKKTAAT
ncbi:hypothetical protein S7711_11198 [Stachybotrys chartarum IBT 7711]|uniref:ATP-grasp domain-containing protein n=1 Tax=Stachybotrys chartarum (strain CBS 109288 / IBT 7711) TaxID=1280523 RepID=A0A084AK05_STACB|nr:hypothetical protein S7711_11198 [Stachybotrys chartarum IBT 7711]KFA76486.1 hypothetical protein S40288_11148 [Stachybotrys chartarum IBT 40288]